MHHTNFGDILSMQQQQFLSYTKDHLNNTVRILILSYIFMSIHRIRVDECVLIVLYEYAIC